MNEFIFILQRFAEVLVGKANNDKLTVIADKTQVYGLAGNDTLASNGKKDILLIGGSGNDVLNMTGGEGTLSGGKGSDTFNLSYSARQTISAVIEDIDPDNDRIFITYDGDDIAQLTPAVVGNDVVWTDDKGYFNLTLKGSNDASDYYEGTADERIWDILRIVNQEREDRNLSPLTLAQGLMDGTSIRAQEIEELFGHTRPDGTSCFTALKKSYSYTGENCAAGNDTAQKTMVQWMNSTGHRANILNSSYKKLGVGYYYDSKSKWKHHWVQMFAGSLDEKETLSTEEILSTQLILDGASISEDNAEDAEPITNSEPNVTINGSADNDSIQSEADNVAINGGDGNDTITVDKTTTYNWDIESWEDTYYNKATISGGNGADVITNYNFNASINGGAGFDKIFNHGDNSTIHAESGNDLVINGEFFSKGGASVEITGGEGNDTITNSGSNSLLDGGAGDDLIYNGYYYFEPWNAYYDDSYNKEHNDKNGSSNTTIIGGAGNDHIKNRAENVLFKYSAGDGNDFIEGFNSTSTLGIANGTYSTTKNFYDIIVTVGKDKITLSGAATLSKLNIVTLKSDSTNSSTSLTVTNSMKSPVTVGAVVEVIDASKRTKAVKITGNDLDNSIRGGSGKDTLWGGAGNDTLTGGKGKDIFIYSAGKDVITDYAAGDQISLGAAISKTTLSGSDVVFTIGKGSLTIKDGKSKTLSLIDSAGKSSSTIIGGATKLTVTDKTKSPVTVDAAIKTITASKRTAAVKITGNALANTITGGAGNDSLYGGKGNDSISGGKGNDKLFGQAGNDILRGGAGNDTLTGGKGNDSLWGDAGKDVFVYTDGDGKDIVSGFEDDDILKISGTFSATYDKAAQEIYFKVGDTSKAITLKNFSATSFKINSSTYKISGKNLVISN